MTNTIYLKRMTILLRNTSNFAAYSSSHTINITITQNISIVIPQLFVAMTLNVVRGDTF